MGGNGAGVCVGVCGCVSKFVSQWPAEPAVGLACFARPRRHVQASFGGSLPTLAASVVLFGCMHIFVAEEKTLVTRESTIAYLPLASIVTLKART